MEVLPPYRDNEHCYDFTTQSEKTNPEAFAALRGFIYPLSCLSTKEQILIKYTPKHQVKVGGKMSEKDAGIAGKMLASAAIIAAVGFAIGAACFGISFIL